MGGRCGVAAPVTTDRPARDWCRGITVIGFDLFDVESTLRKLLPKLVRSAAIEALEARETSASLDAPATRLQQSCEQFLAVVAEAPATVICVGHEQDADVIPTREQPSDACRRAEAQRLTAAPRAHLPQRDV